MAIVLIGEPYCKTKNSRVKHLKARCECGKEFEFKWYQRDSRRSCGCLKTCGNRRSHGHCRTGGKKEDKTYVSWRAMRERCNNPNNKMYSRYGGRGISVCERWEDYENFLADMPPKPDGATLERIDNDGDYHPDNCRWATRKEQNRNSTNNRVLEIYGQKKCVAEWCEISGVSQSLANARLNKLGWTEKESIFGRPKD